MKMIFISKSIKNSKKTKITNIMYNIQQLYKSNIAIFMYKFFNKQLPTAFNNVFQTKTSNVITRSNSQIISISCKNTVSKQSIRYIGPKIWNQLPASIKKSNSLSAFNKKAKIFLKNYLTPKLLASSCNLLLVFFLLCFRKSSICSNKTVLRRFNCL